VPHHLSGKSGVDRNYFHDLLLLSDYPTRAELAA
jgi:hypothetical protein